MEEVLIVFIIFTFTLLIIKMGIDFAREKSLAKTSSRSESSLTSSELKALVQDAVEDAIQDQFAQLERRLERKGEHRLMPAHKEDVDVSSATPESPPVQSDRESLQ